MSIFTNKRNKYANMSKDKFGLRLNNRKSKAFTALVINSDKNGP